MANHYPFTLPPLPFDTAALEPFIDRQTVRIHHKDHLGGYVNTLNALLAGLPALQNLSLLQLLTQPLGGSTPASAEAIRQNAGGVYNHVFYFNGLAPAPYPPKGRLADAITARWGSLADFWQELTDAALSVFGSGYAWLVSDRAGELLLLTTANQDTPLTVSGTFPRRRLPLTPLLAIDVWEHAYYLKHRKARDAYLADLSNVISWPVIEARYLQALG